MSTSLHAPTHPPTRTHPPTHTREYVCEYTAAAVLICSAVRLPRYDRNVYIIFLTSVFLLVVVLLLLFLFFFFCPSIFPHNIFLFFPHHPISLFSNSTLFSYRLWTLSTLASPTSPRRTSARSLARHTRPTLPTSLSLVFAPLLVVAA